MRYNALQITDRQSWLIKSSPTKKTDEEVDDVLRLLAKFRHLVSRHASCTPPHLLANLEREVLVEEVRDRLAKEISTNYAIMDLKISYIESLKRLQVSVLDSVAASELLESSSEDFYVLYFSFFDIAKHKLLRATDHRLYFLQLANDFYRTTHKNLPKLIAVDQDMNCRDSERKPHGIRRYKDRQCICSNLLRAAEQHPNVNAFRVAPKAPLAIAKASSLFPTGLSNHMAHSLTSPDSLSPLNCNGYLNIAVLGRSGIGKTTFIKSCCNYLSFQSLTEAAAFHANILDPLGNYDLMKQANTAGVTKYVETMLADSYTVRSARGRIRFVDTPGHGGDTFDAVQRYLWTNLDELHGICLLLDPNEFPLNEMTCSFLEKILRVFPPRNIVFCFTRARSSSFQVGLSLFGLEKLVKVNDWEISLDEKTMYCIDNEPMQYLAQQRVRDSEFGFDDIDRISQSWEHAHSTTLSLLQHLMLLRPCPLPPGSMCAGLEIEVLRLTEPIARLGQCLAVSLRLLEGLRGKERASAFELRAKLAPRVFCSRAARVESLNFSNNLQVMVIRPEQFPRCSSSRRMSTVIPDEICLKCGGLLDSHKHLTVEYSQAQVPLEQLLEKLEAPQMEKVWDEAVRADLNKLLDLAVGLSCSLGEANPVDDYLRVWLSRCEGARFHHVRESIKSVREVYRHKRKMVVHEPPDPFALIQTLHRWPRYAQVFHQASAADPSSLPVWLI